MSAKDKFKKIPLTNGFSENKRFRLFFFSQNNLLILHNSNLIHPQMFKSNLFIPLLLLFPTLVFSQHRALKHNDYLSFSIIESIKISDNGETIAWLETLPRDNNTLKVFSNLNKECLSFSRAAQPQFIPESNALLFLRKPDYKSIQKLKRQKKKSNELPTDTLVLLTNSDLPLMISCIKEVKTPPVGFSWLAYTSYDCDSLGFIKKSSTKKSSKPEANNQASTTLPERKKSAKSDVKIDSWPLTIMTLPSKKTQQINSVTNWEFSDDGSTLWVVSRANDSTDSLKISRVVYNKTPEVLTTIKGKCNQIGVAANPYQAAFIFQSDSINDISKLVLINHDKVELLQTPTQSYDSTVTFSKHRKPTFSNDGERMFYGTAKRVPQVKPDSLLKDEIATVDVWHWNDKRIMPQQLKELSGDKKSSLLTCLNLKDMKTTVIEDDTLKVSIDAKYSNLYLAGRSDNLYQKQSSWDEGLTDLYVVNALTGKGQIVTRKSNSRQYISPNGLWSAWFNSYDSAWYLFDVLNNRNINLTHKLNVPFYNIDQDTPELTSPYPFIGWSENSDFLLIRDQYDIWRFTIDKANEPSMVTQGIGKKNQIAFSLKQFNPRALGINESSDHYLEGYSDISKSDAIWYLADLKAKKSPNLIFESEKQINFIGKANNSQTIILSEQDYNQAPQLWLSKKGKLSDLVRISQSNQIADSIAWGTCQLIKWTSPLGYNLEGLVYLPENYDSQKKYPTILYFYERNNQQLHTFFNPRPSRSIINIPWFVSNDYIVFVPDIKYKTGFPGQSAYDCVMSGLDYVIDHFAVDTLNMGLQGHSWGGYQIGYIITKTSRFKAAWAGAPVANMTSAYGGIRYESGISRMFQYEKSQSRIGKPLWDVPNLYLENSPLFEANKINTPLVILANDADGAVPWTQGIEFFSALRRLNKAVWLINYNGEPHNLNSGSWGNRMDLSYKLSEFFGHFLKGEPAPEWITTGIPALNKEKNGYRPTN